jgi:hypothetical protein
LIETKYLKKIVRKETAGEINLKSNNIIHSYSKNIYLNFLLLNENHMLPTVSLNKNNQIMIPSSDQLIKCVSTVQKSYLHT